MDENNSNSLCISKLSIPYVRFSANHINKNSTPHSEFSAYFSKPSTGFLLLSQTFHPYPKLAKKGERITATGVIDIQSLRAREMY